MFNVMVLVVIAVLSAMPLMFRRRWMAVLAFVVVGASLGVMIELVFPDRPITMWEMPVALPVGWSLAVLWDQQGNMQKDGTYPVNEWMFGWAVGGWVQAFVFLALLEAAKLMEVPR